MGNKIQYPTVLFKEDSTVCIGQIRGDNLLVFQVNKSGIVKYHRTAGIGYSTNLIDQAIYNSSLKLSNDKKQLAVIRTSGNSVFTLYDFNKANGAINNPKIMLRPTDLPNYNYCLSYYQQSILTGIAFSSNDSLIYVVYRYFPNCNNITLFSEIVYQLDRYHAQPYLTKKIVGFRNWNRYSTFGQGIKMFTGPDDKTSVVSISLCKRV